MRGVWCNDSTGNTNGTRRRLWVAGVTQWPQFASKWQNSGRRTYFVQINNVVSMYNQPMASESQCLTTHRLASYTAPLTARRRICWPTREAVFADPNGVLNGSLTDSLPVTYIMTEGIQLMLLQTGRYASMPGIGTGDNVGPDYSGGRRTVL